VKRSLAGLLLLVLSAAGVYGYTLSERDRAYRRLIAEGDAALARDDTPAAVEAFTAAITKNGDSMVGYLKRGQAYRRRGEFTAAIRDLRRASEIDPGATRPLEELGDAYLADTPHRYGSAGDRYREYVALDNRAPRVLYKLAFARYHEGRTAEAIDALQRATAMEADLAEAYYLLGLCHRQARNPGAAREALAKAVKLQPTLLAAREELAELLGTLGRTDARLKELGALAALDPGPAREVTLGLALAQAGQRERAVLALVQTAERYPDHAYAYVALGRVWLEIAQAHGDRVALSKALGALENAVRSDPGSESRTLLGRARLLAKDTQAAERVLEEAAQKRPVDPLAFSYLADAAERLGHHAVARQALVDYAAVAGQDADERRRTAHALRLADLSLKMNDMAGAAAYLLRASGGTDPALLARAAEAQFRAGDRGAARETAAKALERDPGNALARAVRRRVGR
jgi:tetratricopeptide (TPR) repeat protein